MPLLARMFGSEAFGIFAVYYSLSNFIGVPSCFRLELALPIADSEAEADHVSTAATCLVIGVSLAVAVLFSFHWPRGYLALCLKATRPGR